MLNLQKIVDEDLNKDIDNLSEIDTTYLKELRTALKAMGYYHLEPFEEDDDTVDNKVKKKVLLSYWNYCSRNCFKRVNFINRRRARILLNIKDNGMRFALPLDKPSHVITHPDQEKTLRYEGLFIATTACDYVYSAVNGIIKDINLSRYTSLEDYQVGDINTVIVKRNQIEFTYSHLDNILVNVGQRVEKGQELAKVRKIGDTLDSYLYFAIFRVDQFIDPRDFMIVV